MDQADGMYVRLATVSTWDGDTVLIGVNPALSMIRDTNIGWRRMGGWRITPRLLWSLNEQQLSTFPGPHPQPFLKTNIHKPRIC